MAIDFNTEPYFDDYNPEKDFYRILFRPSYAVQARELTQIQTILQNQVTRFGDHVFKNGSQVIPGSVNVDNKVHFIKLEQFTGTADVTTYIDTLKNKIITGETSGVKMVVIDTTAQSDAVVDLLDEPTLYCKVLSTSDDNVTNRFVPGENLFAYTEDNTISNNFRLTEDQLTDIQVIVKETGSNSEEPSVYVDTPTAEFPNPESSNVMGYAYSIEVQAGIYYINGIFVRNDDLKLYIGRFTNTPSYRVGFKVTETYVTPEDDETIQDNATGSPNFAAPGAHRYKVSLSLVKLPLTGTDNINFIELIRVVEGRIQYKIEKSSYAELEKTFARRTHDESGNYEVNKFKLAAREHLNNGTNQGVYAPLAGGATPRAGTTYGDIDKFVVVADPGKAYINGYEVESTASQFLEFNKAREIDGVENGHIKRLGLKTIGFNYGNYVKIDNLYKFPSVSSFEKVYLVKSKLARPAILQPVVTGNSVTSITVVDGGFGYTGATVGVTILPVSSFSGVTAVATATITNGKITSVSVGTQGSGYNDVPYAYVTNNLSPVMGAAPTASDIVGTARVKALQLDTSYAQASTVYKLGLFDIQMFNGNSFERDVKSIVGINPNNNFSADIRPTLKSLLGSATSSTGSNTINGVGSAFAQEVKAGDIVYINDVYTGVVASATNTTITLVANAAQTVSSGGRISIFTSTIYEPSYESLLFPVGQNFVKTLKGRNLNNTADTENISSILVRRLFATKNTSTNQVDFKVTDTDETIEADTDLTNYTLINIDTNLPVDINETNTTFNPTGARQTVYFNKVPNGNYRLVASVSQKANQAKAKLKILVPDYEFDVTTQSLAAAASITLPHCDVLKIKSVFMTPGTYTAFDANKCVDVTDRYQLDNGQRDTFYTNGRLQLKPGYQVSNGALRVTYDYFYGDAATGNYFSVDSYTHASGVSYDEIPTYFTTDASTGKRTTVSLADVIDFRPYISGANASSFVPELPKYGSDLIAPVAHYLGRIDKIVLDSVGKFNVITGVPEADPKEPVDPNEGMVLATISVPPYTQNIKDVIVKQRDNKRYTMRDIGKLERRIANLEYYVTLSLLEKDTADLQITDTTTGLDRFKNGFIVDQFTGHGIGDVKNEDYRIAVDPQDRVLRPMHYTQALELVEVLVAGNDRASKLYQKTGDLITLPYEETPFIFNNHATRAMDIHALSMGAFKGQIQLIPEGDNWKSVDRRPDLVAVDDNNYDAIKFMAEELGVTGTKWNEWQTNWTSVTSRTTTSESRQWVGRIRVTGYETTFTDYSGYNWRDGIQTDLTTSVNAQDYGDRVVDVSYVPYMRARPVTVIAQNLKNTTRFFPFFDNVPVDAYFQPADVFTVTRDGQSLMSFDHQDLNNNILADSDRRAFNGKIEQAFSIGDTLVNTTHTATNIESINQVTVASATVTVFVASNVGIRPGHHVVLYNLDYHNARNEVTLNDLKENQIIPASTGLLNNTSTAKQLNLRTFKVTAVSGSAITLANLDGSLISPTSAYSTASYDTGYRGKLLRLKASGVVLFGGVVQTQDTIGPITQQIFVGNIKNGFSIGETVTGTVNIRDTSSYNGCVINAINGTTGETNVATMNKLNDPIITDANGTAVGVFNIPETAEVAFRTGERTFKLTDNIANSNASFDSIGSSVYYSQGVNLSKERTIVSSRSVEFVQASTYEDTQSLPPVRRTTTSTRQLYQYEYDPLAQTFTVSSDGGCFVTGIDLYFAAKGSRPVSIELRNTDNGVPSSKVIPFSKVTLTADQIRTDDSAIATSFKFKSPIYLQDTETYAFVVMTDEPGTQVYVSEMGATDIITKNTIAGQPLTGSLYASQNAKEWEIHPLLDMKFVLNKAKFDITNNANLVLRATSPTLMTLPKDPFEITPNTNKVRVYMPNHGLLAGQTVTISGVATGYYGTKSSLAGIHSSVLNNTHTVLSTGLEKDSFVISLAVTANGQSLITYEVITYPSGVYTSTIYTGTTANLEKGEYGGEGIKCTCGINMDMLYLKTSDLNFQDTSIRYTAVAQSTSGAFNDTAPYSFVANSNYPLPSRANIRAFENQDVDGNGNRRSSLEITASMYSSNQNISPVIDIQQLSAYAISNLIDSTSASSINVPEIDKRVLIAGTNLAASDYTSTGAGTISITSGTAAITGTNTSFTTTVVAGNVIKSGATTIGTVQTVNSNTSITLTGNYSGTTVTNGAYTISSSPSLVFENIGGVGVIRTNIDRVDNNLASAGIGKSLIISNVATGINSVIDVDTSLPIPYIIKNITTVDDTSTYAGNSELDKTYIYLDRAFSAGTTTLDMTTDNDFEVAVYDKYVDDLAPVGVHNLANYVTRTLSLTGAAEAFRIIFDGNIVNNTQVKVYYRTWTGNVDLRTLPYTDTGFVSTNLDPEGKFFERTIDVNGIKEFYNIQVKIVMKSTNTTAIPKIKNFRLIALS